MSKNGNAAKSIKSTVLSFTTQIIIMGIGLILPRLIIGTFGSEINGLFSTVNQVFTYMGIFRAGVGMAAMQALYAPIIHNDYDTISKVLSTSKQYFQKLGRIYLIGVFLIAFGFALFGKVPLNNYEVFAIVVLQGISGWLSFSKMSWFTDLLQAEGKNYVMIIVETFGKIAMQVVEIVVIYTTQNVIYMKLTGVIFMLLETGIYAIYRRISYPRLNVNEKPDPSLLKDRSAYLTFHITGLICTSTDTIVLSLFCGYQAASVYAVYYLIVSAVNAIINTVYASTSFLLGHSYQQGMDKFLNVHDAFYMAYTTLTTSLFSVCYLLMPSFIKLYTAGVADINYQYQYLPLLFCIVNILTCSKNVGNMVINIGGYAQKVVSHAIVEAGINLVLSLILVQWLGIYGALIGTVVSLIYRVIDIMIFSNKNVMKRSSIKNAIVFAINILIFLSIVLLDIHIDVQNYFEFFKYAIIITPLVMMVFFVIVGIGSIKESKGIISLLKKQLKRNE